MKKAVLILSAVLCVCLLTLAAPSLPGAPGGLSARAEVTEEAEVTTEADVAAALARCRSEGAVQLDLTCGGDLYSRLSADSFALTDRLCREAGLGQYRLRYSDAGCLIELCGMTWAEVISYAWADTPEEAEAAVTGFVSQGLSSFTLGCTGSVYTSLLNDGGMYSLLARLGIGDFDLRYSSASLLVENMVPFSGPWAVVGDVYAAADQLAAWGEQGLTRFTLVFDPEVFASLTDDDLTLIDFLGGIDNPHAATSSYGCYIDYGHYGDVTWAEVPSVCCATEEDIVSAIRAFGAQGVTGFRLMTDPDLYSTLTADSFARLHELEAQAGMTGSSMSYGIGRPVLSYSDAVIVADARILSTPDEAIAYVEECVSRQDTEINLFLSAELYDTLMSGVSEFQIGKTDARIVDLTAQAGIADADTSYSRSTRVVTLKNVRLYAGKRILLAVENGTEDALDARDKETLAAARALADRCAASTPLETLRNLHDALCARIVYTIDGSTDEDGTAAGALLNGRAKCDGYSDALYLTGTLAGLEVRYQHGDSVEQGLSSLFATHMWNLVRLDGTWRMVDVTWDDQEDGEPLYAWFNIGEDRAARTHVWKSDMTVALDPVTDLSARPEPEYEVFAEGDVSAAVKDAAARGYTAYSLYVADGSSLDRDAVVGAVKAAAGTGFGYLWLDGMKVLRVTVK